MNLLIVDDEYLVVEEVVTVTGLGSCWVLRRFILLQMQLALFEF